MQFNDFVQGSFKATDIKKEGKAIVLTTTLVGKSTKAPDYKKNQLIRGFLISLGEWTHAHLGELNSQGIKQIKVRPIVEDLIGRLRRNTGGARFHLNGKETQFSIAVGENHLVLNVPEQKAPSKTSQQHLADIRKMLKGNK